MRLLRLLVLALPLAACATPYQEMGLLGGVRASRITEDTVQITASGNAYTDPDTIQRYALRRAAEETIADGYDLFRISTAADRTRVGSEGFAYATGDRRSAWASGFSMPIIKPGQTLMVRMLKGPRPDPMPDGMFDAREVVRFARSSDAASDHKTCAPDPNGKVICK